MRKQLHALVDTLPETLLVEAWRFLSVLPHARVESGPPSAVLVEPLAVPFIAPVEPVTGMASSAPACMAMAARAFGLGQGYSDLELVEGLGTLGPATAEGTRAWGLVAMAQRAGLFAQSHGPGADPAWIRERLREGKLVLAELDLMRAYPLLHGRVRQVVLLVGLDAAGGFVVRDAADPARARILPDDLVRLMGTSEDHAYQLALSLPLPPPPAPPATPRPSWLV